MFYYFLVLTIFTFYNFNSIIIIANSPIQIIFCINII